MVAANSLTGVGSGLDTTSLIQGLISADSQPLNALQSRQSTTQSAISTLSDISTTLGSLQDAVTALSTASGVGSYTGTSSSSAIAISTTGNAQPGSYTMSVTQLARQQRTYSNIQSSASTGLGLSGTLGLQIGTTSASLDIQSTDSLDQIATKINGAGIRASASVFFDGTNYRLQVSGLDTGKDNAITMTQSGFDLGLNVAANTAQKAQNSVVNIDGFDVERSSNQVVGAIQGVTLALTAQTTTPVSVTIATDPTGLESKIGAVVSAYNSLLGKINTAAGHGTTTATNSVLASDSTLRAISNKLSSTLQTVVGTGKFNTLGSIGLSLQKDGTLALDNTKLEAALSTDPTSVTALFAGATSATSPTGVSGGVMGALSSAITTYNQTGTGLLTMHEDDMKARVKDFTDRITNEQARLDREQTLLQTQFTAMDTTVTANNSDLSYLVQAFASTSIK